jgi:hypothetical protein
MAQEDKKTLEIKESIAKEIAYLIIQNEITKISKLHQNIRRLYRKAHVPTFGGHLVFEKAFVFTAVKHIFQIDLSESKLLHDVAESEKLYHGLLQDSSIFSLLHYVGERGLMRLLFLNINHAECNLISLEDMKRVNVLLTRQTQAKDEFKHIMRMYVGYKIMEGVFDRKILNAQEKEIEKLRLSDYFAVPAPSDEEILRTFGWRKLPVTNEELAKIFSFIQTSLKN